MSTQSIMREHHVAERVAIVAVHGVADQERGETARAVAALLINSPSEQVRYDNTDISDFVLAVEPVESMRTQFEDAGVAASSALPATSTSKKLKQSVRSDFMRPDWVTANGKTPDPGQAGAATDTGDQGIDFNDYLLFKATRYGAATEPYQGTRVRMTRTSPRASGQVRQEVDVYEMYWADLSRLSGKLPRIVSELFTLVFRFSRLGRDAVDYSTRQHEAKADGRAGRWKTLSYLQRGLDTAFMTLLTNMFVQLLLLGSFIMTVNAIQHHVHWLLDGVIYAVAVLAALWGIYRYATNHLSRFCMAGVAALLAWGLTKMPEHYVAGIAVLGLLGLLLDVALRIGEARFPGTHSSGRTFFALMAVALLVHQQMLHPEAGGDFRSTDWILAALRVIEYALLGVVAWWGCVPIVMLAWLIAGWRAGGRDPADRRAVATGQIGLFVSITAFLIFTMVLWRAIEPAVEAAAGPIPYLPFAFSDGTNDSVTAASFLEQRFNKSTITFGLIAALLLLVLVHLVVMLVPSIFAEKKIRLGTPAKLGRWLTAGYRGLELLIPLLVGIGVVVAGAVGMLQLMSHVGSPVLSSLSGYIDKIQGFSASMLAPLVYGTAGVAATLTALGGTISRYAPSLRAPLDVALDVDNHFREFPRKAIPRARIFARYTALLEHIVAQGYHRIVIVAHSQGSVISVELLRYFKERARIHPQQPGFRPDRIAQLWSQLDGKIDLLTAGNPLRQLYAARFPALYEWVSAGKATAPGGPAASAVGVHRWLNLYTTGDYVGRWIWAKNSHALYKHAEGLADGLALNGANELDVCLGNGAHTHYFDHNQREVASCVDFLVAGASAGRRADPQFGALKQA